MCLPRVSPIRRPVRARGEECVGRDGGKNGPVPGAFCRRGPLTVVADAARRPREASHNVRADEACNSLDPHLLVEVLDSIAVHVRQFTPTGNDLSFDLESTGFRPPLERELRVAFGAHRVAVRVGRTRADVAARMQLPRCAQLGRRPGGPAP